MMMRMRMMMMMMSPEEDDDEDESATIRRPGIISHGLSLSLRRVVASSSWWSVCAVCTAHG
jgi:hypothetical protein